MSAKTKEKTCSAPWPTVIQGLNTHKILPAFWTLLAQSKKHQIDESWIHLLVHILLCLHQLNEWHDEFGNILCILLSPFGKEMCSTIGNFEQCKRIIDTWSQHIDKHDSLDGCSVTKHSDAKDPSFQKEGLHLLFPVGNIKGIKVLDMCPEVHCNLCNHCYTLGMPGPRPDIRCVQYLPKSTCEVPQVRSRPHQNQDLWILIKSKTSPKSRLLNLD